MLRQCLIASAIALAAGAFAPGNAAKADTTVKVGMLTCNVGSGWGYVVGSKRRLSCIYAGVSGRRERYIGRIAKYGVDIGYLQRGVIVWGVLAPTADLRPGALTGRYGGATGGASVGVGVDANVLVGGFNRSITLQPVSVEGDQGVNVAAGVASVILHYVP
jgi:hypothetical protein